MQQILRPMRLPLRFSMCKSCRRKFSTTPTTKQDESASSSSSTTSTTASPSTSAPAADSRPPKPGYQRQPYGSLLDLLSANQRARSATRASSTTIPQLSQTEDYNNAIRNIDRSKLTPGLSRTRSNSAIFDSAQMLANRTSTKVSLERQQQELDLRRRLGRLWQQGDVYTPADLGPREQKKWLKRQTTQHTGDVFNMLGKPPMSFYRNFTVLSEFVTETGRIRPASQTGLKRKNQRKIARTIRRSIALGIIPSVHKHPMLLKTKADIEY